MNDDVGCGLLLMLFVGTPATALLAIIVSGMIGLPLPLKDQPGFYVIWACLFAAGLGLVIWSGLPPRMRDVIWRIFAPKCGACGIRARGQTPAPARLGLETGKRVCQVCLRRFEREERAEAAKRKAEIAERQRVEAERQRVEAAKREAEIAELWRERWRIEEARQRVEAAKREAEIAERWRIEEARQEAEEAELQRVWTDPSTGLMWTQRDSRRAMSCKEAQIYCGNLRLGGYSDWRLPTVDELRAIHDKSLERTTDGNIERTMDGNVRYRYHIKGEIELRDVWVWSGTPNGTWNRELEHEGTWRFNSHNGGTDNFPFGGQVLAVRGSQD